MNNFWFNVIVYTSMIFLVQSQALPPRKVRSGNIIRQPPPGPMINHLTYNPGPYISVQEMFQVTNYLNQLRQIHCSPPVIFSPLLTKSAQEYAESMDLFEHSPMQNRIIPFGENLYLTGRDKLGDNNATNYVIEALKMWYGEKMYLPCKRLPTFSEFLDAGHFTQMIWKGAVNVGYGIAYKQLMSNRSPETGSRVVVVVMHISPPGNSFDMLKFNVLCQEECDSAPSTPPPGAPTLIQWNQVLKGQ